MTATFTAAFDSDCAACPEMIEKGDEAVFVDDEVQHARCPGDTRPARACPDCFLVHAPGQKDCE